MSRHSENRSALARFDASPNFEPRKAQMIIVHHTNMASFEDALATLKSSNNQGRVSAHYLIGRDGQIVQLVEDHQRAWHAGLSRFKGRADLNSASIGIELDNDGTSAFPPEQMDALLRLLEDLCLRLNIERSQVWGHADIAPARKDDPNRLFPWQQLAAAGFGLWPRSARAQVPVGFDPWQALGVVGYDLSEPEQAALAFNRHYFGKEMTTLDSDDFSVLHDLAQASIGK